MIVQTRDKAKDFGERLRLAIITHEPTQERIQKAFPEMFPNQRQTQFRPTTPEQVLASVSKLLSKGEVAVSGGEGWI